MSYSCRTFSPQLALLSTDVGDEEAHRDTKLGGTEVGRRYYKIGSNTKYVQRQCVKTYLADRHRVHRPIRGHLKLQKAYMHSQIRARRYDGIRPQDQSSD